jgi:hypothetical protein
MNLNEGQLLVRPLFYPFIVYPSAPSWILSFIVFSLRPAFYSHAPYLSRVLFSRPLLVRPLFYPFFHRVSFRPLLDPFFHCVFTSSRVLFSRPLLVPRFILTPPTCPPTLVSFLSLCILPPTLGSFLSLCLHFVEPKIASYFPRGTVCKQNTVSSA